MIVKSEPHALFRPDSEIVVWKTELEFWAGDQMLKTMDVHQSRHVGGSFAADNPVLKIDSNWGKLAADHPVRKATAENATSTGSA